MTVRPGILMVGSFLSKGGKGSRQVCEELSSRLAGTGYQVITTSARVGRISRLFDMLHTIVRRRRDYSVAQVDVFSGLAFAWAELVTFLLRGVGRPYVLTLHGGELPGFATRWPKRVRYFLGSAQAVTSPSPFLKRALSWARDDIRLLPNGIDVGSYGRDGDEERGARLCWLRAFHQIYNPLLAVSVVEILVKEFPQVVLTMNGPDKGDGSIDAVKAAVLERGLERRIRVGGAVPKNDVPATLAENDIFLNTTDADNAPVSVIEAMASGLCVVSTNVGGVPDLLEDGKDSLLVPPGNPGAMAAAVGRLLKDPRLAEELAQKGRAKAREFDWAVVLPKWEELLSEVSGGD